MERGNIDGDLVQRTDRGLDLTTRGDAIRRRPSQSVGDVGDIEMLTTQAAEYVYGRF